MSEISTGWMTERGPNTRVYHYIKDMMAVCGHFGFYRGELTPDDGQSPRGAHDCTKCFKIVRGKK